MSEPLQELQENKNEKLEELESLEETKVILKPKNQEHPLRKKHLKKQPKKENY